MTKYLTLMIIIAARIIYHPLTASAEIKPFANPIPSRVSPAPAKLVKINGSISNKKIFLNWEVEENETAEQFEIEKSTDGLHFSLAALVFSTEEPSTVRYQFYEKAGNRKMFYRVKLVTKNRQITYSSTVEMNPTA